MATERPKWATSAETKRIIFAERRSLAKNWLSENCGQIIVGLASEKALEVATRVWKSEGYERKHIIRHSGDQYNISRTFALVQVEKIESECWVLASENSYRAIYHDYLTQYIGLASDVRLSSRYHIDHVLARTRARKLVPLNGRLCYLRVTVAPERSNIGAGRVYERFATERDLRTTSMFAESYFNFPLAIKAFDLPIPESRDYSDKYVVEVCRRMQDSGLLPESELETPYALMRNIFMRSSVHKAIDNEIRVVSGNHVLTLDSSLREWISYF